MTAMESRLAELAVKFLDRTDTDIASMRESLGKITSGDTTGVDEIHHLAHRMTGTGATLGFESLSERAAEVELLAEGCAGGLPDAATRERLHRALDELAGEFQKQRARRHTR